MSKGLEHHQEWQRRRKAEKRREEFEFAKVIAIPSSEIFEKGVDPVTKLDLRTDPKIPKLQEEISKYIRDNKLQLPRDEEKISEFVITAIKRPEYYGGYDALTKVRIDKESDFRDNIKFLEDKLSKTKPGSKEHKELISSLHTSQKELDIHLAKGTEEYDARCKKDVFGHLKTERFKPNTLVCREYAFISSYLLHSAGIENDYVLNGTAGLSLHSFVQSKATGAIIETTSQKDGYNLPLNTKARLANGDTVFAYNPDRGLISVYGSGEALLAMRGGSFEADRRLTAQAIKEDYQEMRAEAAAQSEKYKKIITDGNNKDLKVNDILKAVAYKSISADEKGKAVDEFIEAFRYRGFIDSFEKARATGDLAKIGMQSALDMVHSGLKSMDKNNDGSLSPVELPKETRQTLEALLELRQVSR